jgi:hypothetical protein
MEIIPNMPVVFDDEFGFPHWGVALSPVIPSAAKIPWPHVLVRIVGVPEPIRIPARDVEVWLPGIAAAQAKAAVS